MTEPPPLPPVDPVPLLEVLERHRVRFVLIGGIAAVLQGSPYATRDVDITPAVDAENLERLAAALRELEATLRVADEAEGVPFPIDAAMLSMAASWTLRTHHGDLDVITRPAGTDGYRDLVRDAEAIQIVEGSGLTVQVASLVDLVRSKEASGREKDLATLPGLRRTLQLRAEDASSRAT